MYKPQIDMNLEEVISLIEKDLPGWTWLLRSDKRMGYFANLLSPNHVSVVSTHGQDRSLGQSYPRYAPTPVETLIAAYRAAIHDQSGEQQS